MMKLLRKKKMQFEVIKSLKLNLKTLNKINTSNFHEQLSIWRKIPRIRYTFKCGNRTQNYIQYQFHGLDRSEKIPFKCCYTFLFTRTLLTLSFAPPPKLKMNSPASKRCTPRKGLLHPYLPLIAVKSNARKGCQLEPTHTKSGGDFQILYRIKVIICLGLIVERAMCLKLNLISSRSPR